MYKILIVISVIILLMFSFIYYELKDKNLKKVAAIATLAAVAAALRVVMAPFPNIMPTTFLVSLTGFIFGANAGFITGALAAFLSNVFLGQGPWTIFQMFAFGIVGLISAFLPKNMKTFSFSVICFFYGFLFDYIVELWYLLGFVKEINFSSVSAMLISGFVFDLLHGGSNFFFSIVFFKPLKKVFIRYKDKLSVERLN